MLVYKNKTRTVLVQKERHVFVSKEESGYIKLPRERKLPAKLKDFYHYISLILNSAVCINTGPGPISVKTLAIYIV
jgi:hypothetical protein